MTPINAIGPIAARERLLERNLELASIDVALESAVSGAGALTIVEGPAGIGKSTFGVVL